jgi:hypothetical protein
MSLTTKAQQLNLLSEASKNFLKINQPSDGSNFITLGNFSEKEKIEIIQIGFQLNRQGKILLKNKQVLARFSIITLIYLKSSN